MTIENIPVWPFEANWTGEVRETLEWLTDVLTSPTGAEQRRILRNYPRRTFEFGSTLRGRERALFDRLVMTHGARDWYLPIWHEAHISSAVALAGGDFIPCTTALNSELKVGDIIFISDGTPFNYELVEVDVITNTGITTVDPLVQQWAPYSRIHPVRKARFTDQPEPQRRTDDLINVQCRFMTAQANDDVIETTAQDTAGPMIVDGLIVNSYHQETGRGGYFHHNSGTSEGQFVFIYAMFQAYAALKNGDVEDRITANYYLNLAYDMLDAMGTGAYTGPMLRQPIPSDPNTITLMHWLFAARGDVPEQGIVLNYEATPSAGKLVIPSNWYGGRVMQVWQIYPATSELLYDSPYSPAFDIASPGAETQVEITTWNRVGDTTEITIPAGTPAQPSWKVVYGYTKPTSIPVGEGYEAFPSWTKIPAGYSACAPDTFRWFEQAMERAVADDDRSGKAADWSKLRMAMRRSAIKGQAITDLREVLKPMPGFAAIPSSGDPDGMYCYSDHPAAVPPVAPGLNPSWTGYDFWTRNDNGDLVGQIPNSTVLNQVQIGRGFSDEWRTATAFQDADQYLWITISASKKPIAAQNEYVLVYVSSTMAYDESTRWYADIGSLSSFVASSSGVIEFFIPRSAFKLRSYNPDGSTSWGSTLPAGTHIENFGVSLEMKGAYTTRIRNLRLVSNNTADATAGAEMPYFPGAMPFAINADTRKQQYVGFNGNPFHGYQLADFWYWLESEADLLFPTLVAADLPVMNRTTGAIAHPINALTGGGVSKPRNALLMEQQLLFLKHAQEQWQADGGDFGPFAHTFVLNTPARATIGNPTPHTWVYTNDDPNTRWVGYQVRVVESLALLCDLTKTDTRFATARTLAEQMAEDWLSWLNGYWPNLSGTIKGMPTDFDDPAGGLPETLYEEPHAASLVLRACLWMEKAGAGNSVVNQALMVRCWQYLELMWRTTGEMAFTWSPDPANKQWYGFWHGEIICTLSDLLLNDDHAPAGIDLAAVKLRLVQTQNWLERYGVRYQGTPGSTMLEDIYRGFGVVTSPPDEADTLNYGYERMLEELDNQTGIPYRRDTAGIAFTKQKYNWVLAGRAQHKSFRQLAYSLRGRAVPVWLPTFFSDFTVVDSTPTNDSYLIVQDTQFTALGGASENRRDICIELIDGSRLYRRIVSSTTLSGNREVLGVDTPFFEGLNAASVLRVSFMTLSRLDQDSIEIVHQTDSAGVATVTTTFRAAPNIRQPLAGN